jgi:hypothetical protein
MAAASMSGNGDAVARRRALRTAFFLAALALAFYVGIFFIVKWRHP